VQAQSVAEDEFVEALLRIWLSAVYGAVR
jgi:hypothetical protein